MLLSGHHESLAARSLSGLITQSHEGVLSVPTILPLANYI